MKNYYCLTNVKFCAGKRTKRPVLKEAGNPLGLFKVGRKGVEINMGFHLNKKYGQAEL